MGKTTVAEEIVRRGEGALVLAPETRSIDDLIALQSRCGVFLACDSGPLHVASLVGVPVVQLLGPSPSGGSAPARSPSSSSSAARATVPGASARMQAGSPHPRRQGLQGSGTRTLRARAMDQGAFCAG